MYRFDSPYRQFRIRDLNTRGMFIRDSENYDPTRITRGVSRPTKWSPHTALLQLPARNGGNASRENTWLHNHPP